MVAPPLAGRKVRASQGSVVGNTHPSVKYIAYSIQDLKSAKGREEVSLRLIFYILYTVCYIRFFTGADQSHRDESRGS